MIFFIQFLRDLGIDATAAIPEPVLHGYTIERGVFEDSTYWNPSWTINHGAIETSSSTAV